MLHGKRWYYLMGNPFDMDADVHFYRRFFCFAEDDGGDDAGGKESGPEAPAKPENLQEKFWDASTNSVKVNDLSNAYNELSASYTRKTEDIRAEIDKDRFVNRPESADKYEVKIPDTFEAPPGYEFNIDQNSPLVTFWREKAFEMGLGQEGFEAGVASYAAELASKLPVLTDEIAALGENGEARYERATDWLKSVVSEEEYGKLGNLVTTAEGISVVEKIMEKSGVPFERDNTRTQMDPEDDPNNQPAYDNKTRRLMADPKAQVDHPEHDPTLVQMYRDRWEKAYPGSQGPEQNAPRSR